MAEEVKVAKAHLKYARISPRKVKIVLDLIRGKDTATAMGILRNTPKAASEYLVKLLASAVANADRILKRTSHVTIVVKEKD